MKSIKKEKKSSKASFNQSFNFTVRNQILQIYSRKRTVKSPGNGSLVALLHTGCICTPDQRRNLVQANPISGGKSRREGKGGRGVVFAQKYLQ